MGSGSLAEQESALAVRLLEQFLRAGVRPENALRTLNSALALRNDEAAGGFTTIDLLRVDLFTGEAGVYKYGAAPTYVKKGYSVSRITGTALPAGLTAGEGGSPRRDPPPVGGRRLCPSGHRRRGRQRIRPVGAGPAGRL